MYTVDDIDVGWASEAPITRQISLMNWLPENALVILTTEANVTRPF